MSEQNTHPLYDGAEFRPTVLSAEAFDELLEWLDEPPRPLPALAEAFKKLRVASGSGGEGDER